MALDPPVKAFDLYGEDPRWRDADEVLTDFVRWGGEATEQINELKGSSDDGTGGTGPRGPVGPSGPVGPVGPPGPAGADGAPGSDGSSGADGADGADGRGISGITSSGTTATVTYTDGATQDFTLAAGPEGPEGPQGDQGIQGDVGPAGPGLPTGGDEGQVAAKASGTDYNTEWVDVLKVPEELFSGTVVF